MRALLPDTAIFKTWNKGEQPGSALESGDRVLAYDVGAKDLRVVRLTITPVPPQPVIQFLIQHFRWINLFGNTEVHTVRGLEQAATHTDLLMSYCLVNPRRMVMKTVMAAAEAPPIPGAMLEWDSADLVWSEGLLIGSTS